MMYKGRIVVVTGSSRGVGKQIAEHFLNNSAKVIGLSRSSGTIEHPAYTHFSVDIGQPEGVIKTFREINKQFHRVDIVINNAAVLTSRYSMIMPVKNAVDMVQINLLGVFFVSREAAKLMFNNTYGRIINIGSMATSLEPVGDSVYTATKVAIGALANCMARELGGLGKSITCNTLGITAIETDMLKNLTDVAREKIDKIIEGLRIPRYAEIDDILNVIDFYASPRSSYITAQTIFLGGIN